MTRCRVAVSGPRPGRCEPEAETATPAAASPAPQLTLFGQGLEAPRLRFKTRRHAQERQNASIFKVAASLIPLAPTLQAVTLRVRRITSWAGSADRQHFHTGSEFLAFRNAPHRPQGRRPSGRALVFPRPRSEAPRQPCQTVCT